MRCRILPLLFAMVIAVAPASAQQLSLTIQDGLVNLDAEGASIRQILDAWSRIGGTTIVNADRVSGGPVTLKLVNTPERQALEVILRSAAGYISVPRAANAAPGDSMFDRIMVLPTSTAPQNAATRPPAATPPNPFFRGGQTDEDEQPANPELDPAQPPVFTFPNQAQGMELGEVNPFMQGGRNQQAAPFGQPAQAVPFGQPMTQPGQQTPFGQIQPTTDPFGQGQTPMVNPFAAAIEAAQQQQQLVFPNMALPAPGTFTIIGSPTPGVVQQPPAQPLPPGQRPPGQQ